MDCGRADLQFYRIYVVSKTEKNWGVVNINELENKYGHGMNSRSGHVY